MAKWILTIIAACTVTFFPVFTNNFVIWDDDSLITKNPLVQNQGLDSIKGAFTSYDPELYVPLPILSYQLEHSLVGNHPALYHVDNLILHIICALLVLQLLMILGVEKKFAIILTFLFALHPLNSEAVAWASARKDLLSSVFALGAIIQWLKYRENNYRKSLYISIGLYLLACLSKASVIPLPLILLLLDWKDDRLTKKSLTLSLPYFVLSGIFLMVALFGKTENIASLSIIETILLSIKSTMFNIVHVFIPLHISSIYQETPPITLATPFMIASIIGFIVVVSTTIYSLQKTKNIGFGLMFFGLFLAPSFANFSKSGSVFLTTDRYVYLPMIGILLMLGWWMSSMSWKRSTEKMMMTISIVIMITFGFASHTRATLWGDSETLFRDALMKNPNSAVMHFNLAVVDHLRGKNDEARAGYERAIEISPKFSKAHTNLGFLYAESGDDENARAEYLKAIETDPNNAEAYSNFGSLLMDEGKLDEAILQFQKAIVIAPRFARAYANLGAAYGKKEMYKEGLEMLQRAKELDASTL